MMTSTRPYLVRAMYDWIVDNACTPHLLVDATVAGVEVPRQYVDKGVIVLNVAPSAVRGLVLGNDEVGFSARFGGTPYDIRVPIAAVQAIYARENGQGIFLADQADAGAPAAQPEQPEGGNEPSPPKGRPPHLTVVK